MLHRVSREGLEELLQGAINRLETRWTILEEVLYKDFCKSVKSRNLFSKFLAACVGESSPVTLQKYLAQEIPFLQSDSKSHLGSLKTYRGLRWTRG